MSTIEIMNVEQLSQTFGVKEITIREWIKNNRIPAKKFGKRWFVSKQSIVDMIEREDLCPNCLSEMVSQVENVGFDEPSGPSHYQPSEKYKCPKCGISK